MRLVRGLTNTLLLPFLLALGALAAPGVSFAGLEAVESDARTVPWPTLRRLALEGGVFMPSTRPVGEGELADLLTRVRDAALENDAAAFTDAREFARLEYWLGRYAHGGGGVSLDGCECKTNPFQLRLTGRSVAGFTDLGDVVAHEAGLAWAPGWNATVEPIVDFGAGPWWLAVSARLAGGVGSSGVVFDDPDDPLTWPGWNLATGKDRLRRARQSSGAWTVDLPRLMGGVRWGNWALNAGWTPRNTGVGETGALALDDNGVSLPAFTARRARPFVWGDGFWRYVSPASLQWTVGPMSRRTIRFNEGDQVVTKEATPWFFQWLIGWEVEFVRATLSHSAMAAPREGSLWGDLWQINFPTRDTTWDEVDGGPVTDRILAVQLEVRWRRAPWPLLPSAAGRLYWDYGGTDTLPSGPGGYVPQISVPASVIGFELLGPVWDLGMEYAELTHPDVLWYTNTGFPETGYSHEDWVLGHGLGGSGERLGGVVRWRPGDRGLQAALDVGRSEWGTAGQTPGTGSRWTAALTLGRDPMALESVRERPRPSLLWSATLEWNREEADRDAYEADPGPDASAGRDWWRLFLKLAI